ncbi:hypothetical protein D9M71_721950 [compost metagenome]
MTPRPLRLRWFMGCRLTPDVGLTWQPPMGWLYLPGIALISLKTDGAPGAVLRFRGQGGVILMSMNRGRAQVTEL